MEFIATCVLILVIVTLCQEGFVHHHPVLGSVWNLANTRCAESEIFCRCLSCVYAIAVLCRAGVCHVYMQQLCSALWVFVMCICYSCVLSFRCLSCVYALAGFCLAGVCHVYMQQLCSVLQVFGAVPRDQTIGFPQGSGGQSANVGHFYASVLPFL